MNGTTPEPDVRQVMVGSFLDHPTATLPGLIEFGSHVPDDVTDALAIVDRLLADDRLHITLSTPPEAAPAVPNDCECDDREALVRPEGLVCGTCGKVIDAGWGAGS